MEPLSIAIISGAVGGAAGAFSKEVWGLGKNWIDTYFKNHAPKAIEKAEQNSLDFLAQLAQRVKILEEQGGKQRKSIEDSLNQPDFSALLQKAMISSAQTEDKQKHELLARLVADRLTKQSDSLFSLTSQVACEAVSGLNIKQMKILGTLATIFFVRPSPFPSSDVVHHNGVMSLWWSQWLEGRLKVYQDVTPITMDFLHLESLSCVKYDTIASRQLERILKFPEESGLKFDYKVFSKTDTGRAMIKIWKSGLEHALPTTTGILIGIYVSDMLLNTTTSFDGWGES